MRKAVVATLMIVFWVSASALAATATYSLNMTGAGELPAVGDPDGLGVGTISLDDLTGVISWDITYSNLDPLTAMHIHTGPAGTPGPVFIPLGIATIGGPGTLENSITWSTLSDITSVLNDPAGHYINLHTTGFPGGAIRDQLGTPVPEPTTWLLTVAGLPAVAWLAWRRRHPPRGQ